METTREFIHTFRIEEFKALRFEILYQIQEIDRIKFWVAAGLAAYYSFVAAKFLVAESNKISFTGPLWIWAAPIVLPVLGYMRLKSQIDQLEIIAKYIRQIEDLYPGLPGWEHFYLQRRSEDTVWIHDEFYFAALFLFSVAVLLLRWRLTKPSNDSIQPA